jgi:hypothetical protein
MIQNNVSIFFLELAKYYNIKIEHKWMAVLWETVGPLTDIKAPNRMHSWVARGYIPELSINNLLKMDLPDELKALCESCGKEKKISKEEAKKQIREIRNKKQLKHEEVIALFQDQASALELNLDLVELEKTDKRKYDYVRGLVRGFVLDARPKKNANHS